LIHFYKRPASILNIKNQDLTREKATG